MYVYLSVEGQEAVALGKEPSTWSYSLYPQPITYEGFTGMLIGEVTITLPTREACMEPVLTQLKVKEQTIQAEAYEEMMEIKARRDALLCLTMGEASHD